MHYYHKIKEYLNKCIEKDILSHAYIFYGPDEISKHKTAFWFADKILDNLESKFHPDLFAVKPDIDDEITIGLVRHLKRFLVLSPSSASHKVVIIESAERLNEYAKSALLKIFEEAPAHAIIILCAKDIDSVPQTIASRGLKIPFWRKTNDEPIRDQKVLNAFYHLLAEDFTDKYAALEKLNGYKTVEIFGLWLKFLRLNFLSNPEKFLKLLKVSQDIYFKLNETNFNPKFAYDELAFNLQQPTNN